MGLSRQSSKTLKCMLPRYEGGEFIRKKNCHENILKEARGKPTDSGRKVTKDELPSQN